MCSSISGNKSALCNPAGWCTVMAGENFAGLCNVFGNVAKTRIKSCKFYFKDHRNEKASKLDSESSVRSAPWIGHWNSVWKYQAAAGFVYFLQGRACQNSFRSHRIKWKFSLHYDKLIIGFPFSKMGTLYKKAECRLVSWKPLEAISANRRWLARKGFVTALRKWTKRNPVAVKLIHRSQKNHPREEPCVTRSTTRDEILGVPLDVFLAKTLTTSRSSATSSLTQLKEERSLSKSACFNCTKPDHRASKC